MRSADDSFDGTCTSTVTRRSPAPFGVTTPLANADEFEITDHIRFNTLVASAEFDSRAQCWIVRTNQGTFTSRFVINGNGYFSEPHVPHFPGRDQFGLRQQVKARTRR